MVTNYSFNKETMEAFQLVKVTQVSPKKKVNSDNKVLMDPSGVRIHYMKKNTLDL